MKLPKKNAIVEDLAVVDIGKKGKGIAKSNGLVVFVEGAVPGDQLDARVTKRKKSYLEGKPVRYHSFSEDRTQPFCSHFGICGGCKWQHLTYEAQARLKSHFVRDTLTQIGEVPDLNLRPILEAPQKRYYRNRLDFAFTNNRWITETEKARGETIEDRTGIGLHVPGRFDKVVDIEHCYLQPSPSNEIRNALKAYAQKQGYSFFDPVRHEGLLRSLIIRTAQTGEVMVILMTTTYNKDAIADLLGYLQTYFPNITSINYVINAKANDTFFDLPVHTYSNPPWIEETINGLTLRLGPKSFFQTNTEGAETLFKVIDELADLRPHEIVYDLYTGVGAIALYLAHKAKKVIGIESVEEAVTYARSNAQLNNIANATFYAGDMQQVLPAVLNEQAGRPDVLLTDPPREGMHPKVVKRILEAMPSRIVYVSCNPATQARDLAKLQEKYRVAASQPLDLFPHTYHVENVVLLNQKV